MPHSVSMWLDANVNAMIHENADVKSKFVLVRQKGYSKHDCKKKLI